MIKDLFSPNNFYVIYNYVENIWLNWTKKKPFFNMEKRINLKKYIFSNALNNFEKLNYTIFKTELMQTIGHETAGTMSKQVVWSACFYGFQ